MASSKSRSAFLMTERVYAFVEKYGKACHVLTLTFHEEIEDKGEAERRFKKCRDWFKRYDFKWCGVWEIQWKRAKKYGVRVWQPHLLLNKRIDIEKFRAFAAARGWGVQMQVDRLGYGKYRGMQTAIKVAKYFAKYVTKDIEKSVAKRVRVCIGSAENRVGTTNFRWVSGYSQAYRWGMDAFYGIYKRVAEFYELGTVWWFGCELTGLPWPEFLKDEEDKQL